MVKWLCVSMLLMSACTVYDLESEGDIYRPRVLAIKMEPPEARIGDRVRITPLVALPVGFDAVAYQVGQDSSLCCTARTRFDSSVVPFTLK